MREIICGVAAVVTAATLSSCGSSTPGAAKTSPTSPDAQVATAALKQELITQSASATAGPLTFNAAQADCTATHVVSAVGVDKLKTYGLLDSKFHATSKTLDEVRLSKADATSVVGAIIDCLGEPAFTSALSSAVTSSITGANTATQRACLQKKLTVAALRPMLISSLSGDEQAATKFYAGLLACTKG